MPERRLPQRAGGGLLLPLLAMVLALLAGCHGHKTKLVYTPSAPPTSGDERATNHDASRAPARPRRGATPSIAEPPGGENDEVPRGKPISSETGLASWYGPPYHNHQAADGSIFDQNALTAAHRTLPMGTVVRVTNLATNQAVTVRITDRGPFVSGRTLDLSLAAAKAIGVYRMGVAKVRVDVFANSRSDPAGRWCVQIGVFIDASDAIQLKNDLARRYTTAKVIEFAGPTGHWVRINPAQADHSTAERIAESIHLPDAEPFLVRTN